MVLASGFAGLESRVCWGSGFLGSGFSRALRVRGCANKDSPPHNPLTILAPAVVVGFGFRV